MVVIVVAACAGSTDTSVLTSEPILDAAIPGTAGGRLTVDEDEPTATKLFDVIGDWTAVSVAIAELVQAEGWTIERINCVGTGNDVIARKQANDTWLLLESGAGTAGAGLILTVAPEQRPPADFRSTGPCPQSLIAASGGGESAAR
jgi:hypothetical protein